ncbi:MULTISPECIES: biopolymer transporter ExbD [unclassified Methylophilus]|jgi:biopolymer transport protein ExbD|uniref:ExbD/TolR family protein n=1 Tax=unclassified Methylophilus TaxID=2630143 RepID=UPI00036A2E71|nr:MULTISPECIES: biopolymer transporter ExbD [unclassified Methylophilus]MBF4989274.1 biopolymer transporter ExbD [Methylophilus sp. 14]MBF4991211.1 biopolymer transporter ExbD [Methylophilus sp. QUAN]TXI43268.1 MAG: biopolymer transporter ExbD [Methylophilus sp.]HCU85097.1 biopolymer transporter ExbD [Methylophilus sp.]
MQVQNDAQPYDTINITPMLDLAYVLLVIFILMTTAGVQGLTMNLPKPSNKPSTEKHDIKIVQVQQGGTLTINGVGVSMAELETQLNQAKAMDPKFNVMIKGQAQAPYAGVIGVIDLVNRLQIENVGLVTGKIGT